MGQKAVKNIKNRGLAHILTGWIELGENILKIMPERLFRRRCRRLWFRKAYREFVFSQAA
jgi:hypothetical protein